jgi:hypothetical protein
VGRFTKISQTAFDEFQLEAGLILNTFNPASPDEVTDTNIVCATTGGIEIACKPTFTDYGEDVDNVPNNMLEFKRIDGWDCTMSFTALNASANAIKLALGAADVSANKITPRSNIADGDAKDIWWVGDRADGGLVACCIKNALSTDGLTLKTTKKGKGQLSCTLTGHVSVSAQDVVPMEFYVMAGEGA